MADARPTRLLHPRYWPTWFGLALMRLLSWMPLPLLALLGNGLGLLLYALHAQRRHIVRVNLALCFPDMSPRQRARLARRHFRGFGQAVMDIGIAWWGSAARLRRLVRLRGHEHYEQALREKRNIILLVPHFLGLEFGGFRLSIDRPMVTIFRHLANELLNRVMMRARTRFQMRLVEHIKPLTTLVRQVKTGTPLYYLPDQDAGPRQSVFAPFFGIPAATFVVLPRLARMTDAVVVPCFTRQLSWGRGYEIIFRPPLEDFPTGDAVADTTRMNREIEECVRAAPAQYFWLHKRFKTRPEGEPDFYKQKS
jgi:KDO2-lipid IV(A) lauroyltransferase